MLLKIVGFFLSYRTVGAYLVPSAATFENYFVFVFIWFIYLTIRWDCSWSLFWLKFNIKGV